MAGIPHTLILPIVDRSQLESSLETLRLRISVPAHGIHGPGTVAWEIGRENILFLGGGCAALLQLAHPAVASAIAQHSKTQQDAWGRFWRTFRNVWAMVFGDLEQAFRAARRVHSIHCRVSGQLADGAGVGPVRTYHANQPESLLWVYATLLDTSLRVFELVVRRLARSEKDQYVEECRSFGLLFGIPESLMPRDFETFERYMRTELESGRIAAWEPARGIAEFLLKSPVWGAGGLASWYRNMTAGLLPPGLRAGFGFSFGPTQEAAFNRSIRHLRRILPMVPRPFRYLPEYLKAQWRVRHRHARTR